MARYVKGPRRREAFDFRIAATPGHAQQDPEQRLQRPARSRLRRPPGLMDLLPNLGGEKLGQAFLERTIHRLHEPFLLNGVVDNTHSEGKRLFQLRTLDRTRLVPSAAEAERRRKRFIIMMLTQHSSATC